MMEESSLGREECQSGQVRKEAATVHFSGSGGDLIREGEVAVEDLLAFEHENEESITRPEVEAEGRRNYHVLARRYRPQRFSHVVGQDVFSHMLQRALGSGKIPHGLLLKGIRGVGKTTLARLIAKALNCQGKKEDRDAGVEPCQECVSCRAMGDGSHLDVVEIDAASHTGVDDIRSIVDSCCYQAVMSAYKVYIIDEAHMLSKSAFNALLKTLEEPPAHVVFVLATTEAGKIPATVASRCLKIGLRRLTEHEIAAYLGQICQKEGVESTEGGLALIAQHAGGSVRDGLSLLEQAILLGADRSTGVDEQVVRSMLGLTEARVSLGILLALTRGNVVEALGIIREGWSQGREGRLLLEELALWVHRAMVVCCGGESQKEHLRIVPDDYALFEEWLKECDALMLHRFWQMLYKGITEVQDSPFPILSTEMVCLRLGHMGQLPPIEAVLEEWCSREDVSPPPQKPSAIMRAFEGAGGTGGAGGAGEGGTGGEGRGSAREGEGPGLSPSAREREDRGERESLYTAKPPLTEVFAHPLVKQTRSLFGEVSLHEVRKPQVEDSHEQTLSEDAYVGGE